MSEANGATLLSPEKPKRRNRISALTAAEPAAEQQKSTRKIAIIGKAPSSYALAPYDDPSWEKWVIGDFGAAPVLPTDDGAGKFAAWDRTFELHDLEDGFGRWCDIYKNYLRVDHGKPIYTQHLHPEVPNAILYPREAVKARFCPLLHYEDGTHVHYYTNSVSWMIALAIHEGCGEIGLWGVDMAQHGVGLLSEYAHQRPSCELWIGIAMGLGIPVTVASMCDLCKTPCDYGFSPGPHSIRLKHKARTSDVKLGKKKAMRQVDEANFNIYKLNAHREYWEKRLLGLVGEDDATEKKRMAILENIANLTAAVKNAEGQRQDFVSKLHCYLGAEESQMYYHQHVYG